MNTHINRKKVTTKVLKEKKENGEIISMLTAYDYTFAKIFDRAGIDVLLVGDSAANVFSGFSTTLPITLEQMIYHAGAVVKASEKSMVVVDLPFGSYQVNENDAVYSAIRIVKESGANAVKMEGGKEITASVKKVVTTGIPVMGHLGLTPQSINQLGSYEVQATNQTAYDNLIKDALLLQEAGCFAIVLEKIPAKLAKEVTGKLSIPTIGIGAGNECDGQVLVMHDMLGLNPDFNPKFVRKYIDLNNLISEAVSQYIFDVKQRIFPDNSESY